MDPNFCELPYGLFGGYPPEIRGGLMIVACGNRAPWIFSNTFSLHCLMLGGLTLLDMVNLGEVL